MESVRTYRYKIKVAGDPGKNWMDMFCMNLQKFDPVKIGEPKSTPIQKDPYGFPGIKNQSIHMIDVEFRYPCTEPMVKQLARLLNYDENMVRMIQSDYDDSINTELEQYANQASHTPVLTHEELEDAGKDAAKEYGEQYLPRIKQSMDKEKIKMSYASKDVPSVTDPLTKPLSDDEQLGNRSPMTNIYRQPKPETGASASRKGK